MSVSKRKSYVVVDELGMDPLRDKSFDAIQSITGFSYYTVDESEEHNAALISSEVYSTTEFWWVILIYNGIADNFSLKRGTKLKIPNINELTSALTRIDGNNSVEFVSL